MLEKTEIENKIKKSKLEDNGEKYIDAYAYSISVSDYDVTNFNKDYARKVLPLKVRVFEKSYNMYLRPYSKEKVLKKRILYDNGQADMKVFINSKDCLVQYKKDCEKVFKVFDRKVKEMDRLTLELRNAQGFFI